MARKGKHRSRLNIIVALLALLLISYCVLSSLDEKYDLNIGLPRIDTPSSGAVYDFIGGLFDGGDVSKDSYDNAMQVMAPATQGLEVHFIDVGQGKSILIRAPGATALIDCGENDQGAKVLSYLKSQKIDSIDVLIATHPHSDHIGGMDTVIDALDIGRVIMPDIPDDMVPTTKTYTDVLMAIAKKGLKITPAIPGDAYDLGSGAVLMVLGPVGEREDLNNISVIAQLDFGAHAFLFTGDAEEPAEKALLDSGRDVSCTVLDVGHHGSQTSTSQGFLDAVSPDIAVISCGIDNSYGHPHKEIGQRLLDSGAEMYRTDLDGHVVVLTDGDAIEVRTQK
ncbi:MAG: MBL fold metallo-hydrolase [Oscillospiraceae bacterium]|jgi:competence protein ComEC|nr:MBL fold metallo-hydrolase [Oscillospiraceae bacterium]